MIFFLIPALKYSASKSIFNEAKQLADKLNEILFFLLVQITPACGFPWVIYTFFMYFVTDLGSDAFELPLPMW